MSYEVRQTRSSFDSYSNYEYEIFREGQLVARYWHDYRGDEHGIAFANGSREACPSGRMIDFLDGGGLRPTTLSRRAIAYLDERLAV